MKVQHILFPTDFSDLSKAAETYVRRYASHFAARITILHVIEVPSALYGMPTESFFETPDASTLPEEARKAIQTVLPDLPADRVVRVGDAALVINDFTTANLVDLIMMPTHGYGPFRRALIGSVTAKVLHDTKCPVWTMAHEETHALESEADPSRIVCAIDLVPESVHVVVRAAEFAESFGAVLWLAHSLTQVQGLREEYLGESSRWALELQNFYADHARQEIAAIQSQAGTHFEVCVDDGPVAAVIARIARERKANLVITGRGTIEHFLGIVRSHAYPIIHEAPCPVLRL